MYRLSSATPYLLAAALLAGGALGVRFYAAWRTAGDISRIATRQLADEQGQLRALQALSERLDSAPEIPAWQARGVFSAGLPEGWDQQMEAAGNPLSAFSYELNQQPTAVAPGLVMQQLQIEAELAQGQDWADLLFTLEHQLPAHLLVERCRLRRRDGAETIAGQCLLRWLRAGEGKP
jgi:hypothetical protein